MIQRKVKGGGGGLGKENQQLKCILKPPEAQAEVSSLPVPLASSVVRMLGVIALLYWVPQHTSLLSSSFTSQPCPFTYISFPFLVSILSPLSCPSFSPFSFFFLPLSWMWWRPPQVLVTGTEESGFLNFVQYELDISQRAGGDTEGQTTLKAVLSQEHVMTLIQELASSPQTRVSDSNSVPHSLPIPQSSAWPWSHCFTPRLARTGCMAYSCSYLPPHPPNQEK